MLQYTRASLEIKSKLSGIKFKILTNTTDYSDAVTISTLIAYPRLYVYNVWQVPNEFEQRIIYFLRVY